MFEIDKSEFGEFVAELRKQKGWTQKELAQRLFISDKAVSKWERGLSLPDITLLIPLAGLFEITVTELLECHRIKQTETMNAGKVEELVKKAINLSEEAPEVAVKKKKKKIAFFSGSIGIAALELILILNLNGIDPTVITVELLCVIFGGYFSFFAKEKLPVYYDENKINVYSDGPFRMNLPGVAMNNRNWPYIIRVVCVWSVSIMIIFPLMYLGIILSMPKLWEFGNVIITLAVVLGGLFLPLYVTAKKYE